MATLFRRGLEKHIRQNEYQNFFSKLNMLQFSAELKTSHSYDIYFICDSSVRKNNIQEFQQHTHTHTQIEVHTGIYMQKEVREIHCIYLLVHHCCSVAKSCLTLCDPMNCSTPNFLVLQYPTELAQTHVH